jgi:hypothetical protein
MIGHGETPQFCRRHSPRQPLDSLPSAAVTQNQVWRIILCGVETLKRRER